MESPPCSSSRQHDSQFLFLTPFNRSLRNLFKPGELKYSFSEHGIADGTYGTVAEGQTTPCLHLRTAEVWVTGNGSVTAGLTNILSSSLKFDVSGYNNA